MLVGEFPPSEVTHQSNYTTLTSNQTLPINLAIALGVTDYMVKPFKPSELLDTNPQIRRILPWNQPFV